MTRHRVRHWARQLRARLGDLERGSVLVWIAIVGLSAVLLITLLVDGGAKTTANEQAATYAAEAARAASIAVGPSTGDQQADIAGAIRAADSYLAAAGVTGGATPTGPATITVTVTVSRTGPISGHSFSSTRTATARLLVGVEQGQAP